MNTNLKDINMKDFFVMKQDLTYEQILIKLYEIKEYTQIDCF